MEQRVRVLIDCEDAKGLVYKISKVFYDRDLNIDSNREFVDKEQNKFFMRTVVTGSFDVLELENALKEIAPANARLKVIVPKRKKIVILATKESHALGDILIRYEAGELNADIEAVIANHDVLESLVPRFDIPFLSVHPKYISR